MAAWGNSFLGYRTAPEMDNSYSRDPFISSDNNYRLRKVFVYPLGMLSYYIRLLKFYLVLPTINRFDWKFNQSERQSNQLNTRLDIN